MQEESLRDLLHSAASAATMPERFRRPSQVIRAAQPRRPFLRYVVATVAASLMLLVALPGTRAMGAELVKGLVTIWTGEIDGTKVNLFWVTPEASKELVATGQVGPMELGRVFATIDEAEAAAGFRPVETHYPGAQLTGVIVQVEGSGNHRYLFLSANYLVGVESVSVVTEANLLGTDGEWRLFPYSELVAGNTQDKPMTEIRKVNLGKTEAVTFGVETSIGAMTRVAWLQDGAIVTVDGRDPELVLEVARATAR